MRGVGLVTGRLVVGEVRCWMVDSWGGVYVMMKCDSR